MKLVRSLSFILRHPLNRRRPGAALARWLRWQLGCCMWPIANGWLRACGRRRGFG